MHYDEKENAKDIHRPIVLCDKLLFYFRNSALEDFEVQKVKLEQHILEHQAIKQKAAVTEDTLRQLLKSFKNRVGDRNFPEIKKFTGYVEKVIVYKERRAYFALCYGCLGKSKSTIRRRVMLRMFGEIA